MFESIKSLRPHFHSLREIENNVSLDVKLPITWKFDDIIKLYSTVKYRVQDKNDKFTLISLVANGTQQGYDVVFACANEIIKFNREEQEKQRLFQLKVKELEELFKKESLDKLKEITLINNGQETTTSEGVVGQGDGEGQDGDIEPQKSDD